MNKKVLITGANGLLGQKLIDLYLNHADKTLIATGLGACRHPQKDRIKYLELDISKPKEVEAVFESVQPDTVINTAAMTNVDACEEDKASCDLLNVEAVKILADACKSHNVHLIHLSTDFIFNGEHGPVDEEEVPQPLSYYGHSKLKGEQIIQSICPSWTIIRTVLVYGVVADMSRSNIVLWAKSALEKKQAISVVDDQFRTPTLAEDLAMGCFLAEDANARGIFNVSGKDFMSIYELVERVAHFFKLETDNMKKSNSLNLNQAAKRPPITGFIIDKAIHTLGYHPHSFEEGLAILSSQLSRSV